MNTSPDYNASDHACVTVAFLARYPQPPARIERTDVEVGGRRRRRTAAPIKNLLGLRSVATIKGMGEGSGNDATALRALEMNG